MTCAVAVLPTLAPQLNLRDNCEEGPQGNCRIVVS